MNWDAISAIGQIVGAFGVIVSVIYLAQQCAADPAGIHADAVGGIQ
jgi:hypothetical protein